jgi:hypothetical protein
LTLSAAERLAQYMGALKPKPWIQALHPLQREVALSSARWKAVTTARRSGKTVLDTALAADALEESDHDEATLYIARNRGVAKKLFWPKIRGLQRHYKLAWHPNETELSITTERGGILYVVGAEGGDPEEEMEKLRGLKMRRVICDEPGTYAYTLRRLLKDIIEPGLGDLRGDCIVNGTPGIVCTGAWHEISTGILPKGDKRPAKSLEKWRRWQWDIRNNPFFRDSAQYLADVLEENGWDEEEPTFQREYLGRWVVDPSAQVYRYAASRNAVTEVPGYDVHSWVHTVGTDFGVNDSSAWAVLASHPHKRDIYVIESIARKGLLPEKAAELTRSLVNKYRPHALVGDSGGLGKPYVMAYNERFDAGIRMEPAEKTEKRANIELINGDFTSGRLKMLMPACMDLGGQLENLPWHKEDREHEHPGYANDRADAMNYGWRAHRAFTHEEPDKASHRTPVPGESNYESWLLEQEEQQSRDKHSRPWWAS